MSLKDALNRFSNYLVQSEVDAGVRDPITKDFYDPVSGAQAGIFGPNVSSKAVLDDFASARSVNDDSPLNDPPSGGRSFVSTPVVPEYINAEFAKIYGMDTATAYQEALANTAHQREVQDLKAAGLNPVLSSRYGGASGVSGAQVLSSGSSSRGSSVSSDSSGSPLKLISGLAILAGTVAGIATKRPSIGYAVNSAVTSLNKILDF